MRVSDKYGAFINLRRDSRNMRVEYYINHFLYSQKLLQIKINMKHLNLQHFIAKYKKKTYLINRYMNSDKI